MDVIGVVTRLYTSIPRPPTGLDSGNPELAVVAGQWFGHLQIWSPGVHRPYGYTSKLSNIGRQTRGFVPRIVVTLERMWTDVASTSRHSCPRVTLPCPSLFLFSGHHEKKNIVKSCELLFNIGKGLIYLSGEYVGIDF